MEHCARLLFTAILAPLYIPLRIFGTVHSRVAGFRKNRQAPGAE